MLRKGFVNGYWQSEKYFESIEDIIRNVFTFPEASEQNKAIAREMAASTSVSIHVRRGDYLRYFPNNVLDEAYYGPAMAYFTERFKDVHFFIFSNDISWCREHLSAERISFVDWNTGKDSPYDMWLMTQCKHNIIANSSFSWWGAWLNNNPEKIVIAPGRWFDEFSTPDIYCKDWVILRGYGTCRQAS